MPLAAKEAAAELVFLLSGGALAGVVRCINSSRLVNLGSRDAVAKDSWTTFAIALTHKDSYAHNRLPL